MRTLLLARYWKTVCLAAVVLLCSVQALVAASVTLAWDPNLEPDVAGYRVYVGASSGTYNPPIDVPDGESVRLENLQDGATYYVVVTAYTSSGIESAPSDEFSFVAPMMANLPPVVAVNATVASDGGIAPGTIQMQATATDSDGTIARVEFYANATKVGEVINPPHSFTWQNVPAGAYQITAVAVDNLGATSTSGAVNLQIAPAAPSMPRPLVRPAQGSGNGRYEIGIAGAVGETYDVWVSGDLRQWDLLTTVENTTGNVTVQDPESTTETKRFYKISLRTAPVGGGQ